MSMQSDIIDALNNATSLNTRAKATIAALETENADLKSQLAAATSSAGDAVDAVAVRAALAEATASARALTDAIPAGGDRVLPSTPAPIAPPPVADQGPSVTAVPVAPSPVADAAAVSSAGTPSASLVGAKPADATKPAVGAIPTAS